MSIIQSSFYELTSPRELHIRTDVIDLKQLSEYELVAETIYTAISPGTETSAYRGASPLRPGKIYPRIVGYCNVAIVISIGKKVSKFKVGGHILTFQSHRSAFKMHENDFAFRLSNEANLKKAATAYLFHLGYHGLISAGVKSGHHVGIIGAGVLGITTAAMSNIAGANTFLFTNQQQISAMFKDDFSIFSKSANQLEEILKLTSGTGIDIIINTSNKWDDWLLALQLINKGGTIVNTGFPGRDQPVPEFNPLDPQYTYIKHLTIKALAPISEREVPHFEFRFNMYRNLAYILQLMDQNIIKPEKIMSSEIRFTDLENQYKKYLLQSSTLFTTIINWK